MSDTVLATDVAAGSGGVYVMGEILDLSLPDEVWRFRQVFLRKYGLDGQFHWGRRFGTA